jgi:hypothetical protein
MIDPDHTFSPDFLNLWLLPDALGTNLNETSKLLETFGNEKHDAQS